VTDGKDKRRNDEDNFLDVSDAIVAAFVVAAIVVYGLSVEAFLVPISKLPFLGSIRFLWIIVLAYRAGT